MGDPLKHFKEACFYLIQFHIVYFFSKVKVKEKKGMEIYTIYFAD